MPEFQNAGVCVVHNPINMGLNISLNTTVPALVKDLTENCRPATVTLVLEV